MTTGAGSRCTAGPARTATRRVRPSRTVRRWLAKRRRRASGRGVPRSSPTTVWRDRCQGPRRAPSPGALPMLDGPPCGRTVRPASRLRLEYPKAPSSATEPDSGVERWSRRRRRSKPMTAEAQCAPGGPCLQKPALETAPWRRPESCGAPRRASRPGAPRTTTAAPSGGPKSFAVTRLPRRPTSKRRRRNGGFSRATTRRLRPSHALAPRGRRSSERRRSRERKWSVPTRARVRPSVVHAASAPRARPNASYAPRSAPRAQVEQLLHSPDRSRRAGRALVHAAVGSARPTQRLQ